MLQKEYPNVTDKIMIKSMVGVLFMAIIFGKINGFICASRSLIIHFFNISCASRSLITHFFNMSYHAHQELFLRKISAEKGHKHRESNAQEMAQEQFDQFNAAMATAHTPSDACSDYACSDDACSTDDMSHVLPPLPQKEEQKRKGQIDPNAQAIRSLLSQMLSRAIVRKQVRQDGDIGDILKRLEHSCKGMVSTADFGDAAVNAVVCAPPAIDCAVYPPEICSIIFKLVLVFVPHVPAFSPVAINSTPRAV